MADLDTLQAITRYWPGGMDSWTAPVAVPSTRFIYSQNILNKGGIPQTRPGSRSVVCMPRGNAQGVGMFTPENGLTHLLAAVDGVIWVSPQPFSEWRQLIGLQFNPHAKFITFTECLKTTDYDAIGELYYLNTPFRVVIIQDELTRAAYWDGSTYQHQNPTPSNAILTVDNRDETKIGLWGAYSNNRYWCSRGRFVYASDIGNPLKFHESQYLNEAPAFVLSDDCTGIIETPDQEGILCFYKGGADYIQSSIQDRTLWFSVRDFQRKVIDNGCIAPKSLIKQNGMIYWFSPRGWINLDTAAHSFVTSVLDPLDDEMAYSKARIGPNLSRICAGSIENLSLISVPFTSLKNTHTWVQDSTVLAQANTTAWASVWTGWNPVAWVTGEVDGFDRIFFLSADDDGHNRVWEGMTPDRKDNGCDITCSVQFRMEEFNEPEKLKKFKYAEVEFSQLAGTVDAMVAVVGQRGWFDRIMTHEMIATYDRVDYYKTYGEGTEEYPLFASSRKQSRIVRSEEWAEISDCNECGVEGQRLVNRDYGFSVFVGWSGRAAITRLKLAAAEDTEEQDRGACPPDEEGFHVVDGGGCSANEEYPVLEEAFPKFIATSIQDSVTFEGIPISWEASAFSHISQKDAQRRADCKAYQQLLINSQQQLGFPELQVYTEDGLTLIGDLIDFGYWLADQTESITVRLVNVGFQILELGAITIPDALSFTITAGPDITSLDPNAFTFLTITFDPVQSEGIATSGMEIVSALVDSTEVDVPYSYQIVATENPTEFSATGLPAGLSINTATGVISGTPTVIAISNITIGASNDATSVQDTLVLNVTAVLAPPYTPSAFDAADFTAVYGFRVLISGYTGNLFTLRRDSDDVELTFEAGYSPDTLTTWLGGATGWIKEMFDQTGNGRDAAQTTDGDQLELTFNAPNSYPCAKQSTSSAGYLQVNATNPCGAVLTVYNITGGDNGAGLMCDKVTETPEIRNTFAAVGEWDTYNFPTARFVDDASASVYSLSTWHTSRFTRGSNSTFPNPHVIFNSQVSLSREFNGEFAELLISDFADIAALAAADTALVTFWGTPV